MFSSLCLSDWVFCEHIFKQFMNVDMLKNHWGGGDKSGKGNRTENANEIISTFGGAEEKLFF